MPDSVETRVRPADDSALHDAAALLRAGELVQGRVVGRTHPGFDGVGHGGTV